MDRRLILPDKNTNNNVNNNTDNNNNINIDDVDRKEVRWLLERVGVREMGVDEVIQKHILPALKQQNGDLAKSPEVYLAYTHCLKLKYCSLPSSIPIDHLSSCLPILTNKGLKIASRDSVHFGGKYKSSVNLPERIPSECLT